MRASSLLAISLGAVTLLVGLTSEAARPTKRLSDEARGQLLYERHCVQCHGPQAAGDGPIVSSLVKPVPDLREDLSPERRARQVQVVLDGQGTMPAFRASFDRFDAERVMRHMARITDPAWAEEDNAAAPPSAAPPGPSAGAARTPSEAAEAEEGDEEANEAGEPTEDPSP